MDTDPQDQARITVLCLQARMYSEIISAAREEAAGMVRSMQEIAREMTRSEDPQVRKVAAEVKELIDSTHKELIEALR